MSANLKAWMDLLSQMQQCKRADQLVAQHGEPHHKDQQGRVEIWHYPLGVADRILYSIHVSVQSNGSCQAFMSFEPTGLADTPGQRPKLGQSVRRDISEAFRLLGTILGR